MQLHFSPLDSLPCWVYCPAQPKQTIYTVAAATFEQDWPSIFNALLQQGIASEDFALVAFAPADWNAALTPWPAKPLFKHSPAFAGQAPQTLAWLTGQCMPTIQSRFSLPKGEKRQSLLGYSLGGLFALWALLCGAPFQRVASCSGSLWYEGFDTFLATHTPPQQSSIYLSLGDAEASSRTPRLAAIESITRHTYSSLRQQPHVQRCYLQMEAGGHFEAVNDRLARAIGWLVAF